MLIALPTAASAASGDYTNGYFDTSCSAAKNGVFTDNNLATSETMRAGNTGFTVDLCEPTTIKAVYASVKGDAFANTSYQLTIKFYHFNGSTTTIINNPQIALPDLVESVVYIPTVDQRPMSKIEVNAYNNNGKIVDLTLNEIELFKSYYAPVTNMRITPHERSALVQFTAPNVVDYVKTSVFLDGELVGDNSAGAITLTDLKPETSYSVNVQAIYKDGTKIDTVKTFSTTADNTAPSNVTALSTNIKNYKDVTLSYLLPKDTDFSHLELYKNNVLLVDNYKESSYVDKETNYSTSYTYKLVAVDTTGNKSTGVSITVKTDADVIPVVSSLNASIDGKKNIKLTYTVPTRSSYVQIYRNDKLIADNYKANSYTDTNTAYNTNYTYKVVNVADGNKSIGVTKTIKTPQDAPKDASSLSYTATSNSVSIKWRNTTHDDFTAVTIYRKNNTVAANVRALFSAGDGYTKLHSGKVETYTDNSVEPDTSYKYKITTTIAGVESAGVTVDVKTKPVTLDDTTLEQQPNGDYVVTWGAPTTGKMQINVGGTKYAVVPAANKTFTIPAADVKFNVLGSPDVQLVPLNDAEQPVGPGTKPGGGGLGSIIGGGGGEGIFDAPDLVKAAASLLALVGGFILLGLAFRVVPMLVKTIRNALISGGAKR